MIVDHDVLRLLSSSAIGFAAGWVLAWWLGRRRLLAARNEARDRLEESHHEVVRLTEESAAARARSEQLPTLGNALQQRDRQVAELQRQLSETTQRGARLETVIRRDRQAMREKLAFMEDWQSRMGDAYKALSATALKANNQIFLDLAQSALARQLDAARNDLTQRSQAVETMLEPIRDALNRYDQQVLSLERAREKAYGELSQQLQSMSETQDLFRQETGKLVKALRVPHVRGRWGEITLKRVAEMAGLQAYCDFYEQPTTSGDKGRLRPDMMVRLPGGRLILVDAKVPLTAYLDALETSSEKERKGHLDRHAQQVASHIQKLSAKSYWAHFDPTPEFVVLFIPGENFFSAALSRSPGLIESGVQKNVILATPTTLIALLKAVAYGWRQEQAAANAENVCRQGRELYERLQVMARHMDQMGKALEACVQHYNRMTGSLERRVLTAARRFEDMGVVAGEDPALATPRSITQTPRRSNMKDTQE
jgi:DNA recombination protein RmuC